MFIVFVAVTSKYPNGGVDYNVELARGVSMVTAWEMALEAKFPNSDSRYTCNKGLRTTRTKVLQIEI